MQSSSSPAWQRYGLAVVGTLVALLVRLALDPILGDRFPVATFFLSVLAVAALGGRGPAFLATVLGGLVSARYFISPRNGWRLDHFEDQVGMGVYLVVALGIAWLGGALRDARRRAEAEAAESLRRRELSRITLASIGDAVIVTDEQGRVTSLNPVAERLTGWTSVEAAGQPLPSVFRIVNDSTRLPVEDPARRAMRDGHVVGLANHTILIDRDGVERPIDDSSAPIRDTTDRIVGAVLVFRDVSDRKRDEAEIRRAGDRARTILESISEAFFALDRDWRFTYVNRQAEKLLGRRPGDLIGKRFWDEYPGLIGSEFEPVHRRAMEEGTPGAITSYYPDHDRWYEVHDAPSLDGLSIYFRDVSGRVQGEGRERRLIAESAEANARFRAFFEQGALFAGIATVDGTVIETNRLALEACGYTKEDVFGKPFWETPWWRDREDLVGRIKDACLRAAAGETVRAELPYFVADGTERLVDLIVLPIKDDQGRVIFLAPTGTDITDRRQAEDALRESERRFHKLADSVPVHVWMDDEKGHGLLANARYLDYTGLPAEGLLDGAWPDIVHPDDKADYLADYRSTMAARAEYRAEVRLRGRDGTYRWFEVLGRPWYEGARFAGYVGVSLDVTARRQACEALAESEARFRHLANSMPQIVWVARPDSSIEYLNRRWGEYTGQPEEDHLRADRWTDFVHPEDLERLREARDRSQATGELFEAEYRLKRADGVYRWHLGRATPIFDPSGRVVRRFGAATDIDDRRRGEQSTRFLAEASATLAEVVDRSGTLEKVAQLAVPVFADWCSVDLIGEDGATVRVAVAHVDPAKVEFAHDLQRRYPPDPDAPRGIPEVIRSGRSQWVAGITDEMLVLGAIDPEHLRLLRGLGLRSYLCVPLKGRAGTLGAITFVAAESGRVYGPDDLRLAEDLASRAAIAIDNARLYGELKEADRSKNEFLATLAHELRNPLAPIRNALHLMARPGSRVEDFEAERAMAERQVVHLTRLIDDLMDVARISRGKIDLHKQAVDLGRIIAQAVETARPQVEERRHRLTVSVPPGPILLDADPTRLEQILWNLLNNSAKYTEPGGEVALTVEPGRDEVTIRVRDDGIGIKAEMLSRVFQMFVQVDDHREHSQGGLGIGLSLVRTLVELHGGTINVRSDGPGRGSEFTVRLPTLPRADSTRVEPAAPSPTGDGPRLPRRRILVVDDNLDAARSLSRLLSRLYDQDVRVAHNGPDALVEADAFRPEVVLLDIGLPGMNGYEVAQALRARPDFAETLIVALTGWGQEEDRRRSEAAGIDHHLVKPVDPDALTSLLASSTSHENP